MATQGSNEPFHHPWPTRNTTPMCLWSDDMDSHKFALLKVDTFSSISRADLSRFMLDQMASTEYVGKRVVVQD